MRPVAKTQKLDWAKAALSRIDLREPAPAKTEFVGEEELKIEDDPTELYQTKKHEVPAPDAESELDDVYERMRKKFASNATANQA